MVLSKRERYVLFGTLAAVGLLALDRVALTPLLDQRSQTLARKERLAADLRVTEDLLTQRRLLAPKWTAMVQSGLKSDPAEAESQILHAMGDWAQDAGVTLSLLKPDRLTEKTRLPEIAFQAAGTGNLRAVTRLLWRIQTADIPVKVTEMQINSRKEGMDDLSLQLRISTIYAPASAAGRTGAAGGTNAMIGMTTPTSVPAASTSPATMPTETPATAATTTMPQTMPTTAMSGPGSETMPAGSSTPASAATAPASSATEPTAAAAEPSATHGGP